MQRNPKAYIRLRGKTFDIKCYLGNGRPRISGGGAEFEAQRRPQADSVTLFTGNGLMMVDVPVLFDGWGQRGERNDIGPRVDQIYNLCFGQGRNPPPNFVATYPGPGSGGRFQMMLPEELDEPRPIVGEKGTLFRQALILKLVEFNDPTAIQWKTKPGSKKIGLGAAEPLTYLTPRAESLQQIAAKVLGDASLAPQIGQINGIKDIRKKLPRETLLKLPSED